jgi:superfamily II DNA or RNA helicase
MAEAVCRGLAAGQTRLLLKAPTGTGKTVFFAALLEWPGLKAWLAQFPAGDRKMLVIAHREELLDQAARKIVAANPHARVGIEQADRYASSLCDVVIASIQTLTASKCQRLRRLMGRTTCRLVVVDEAHHAAAPSYRTALAHLGFLPMADAVEGVDNAEAALFDDVAKMSAALTGWDAVAPKDRVLIGVTATPNRSDAVGLGCVFQTIAYSYDLKSAISDGWLVPIVPWVVETDTSLDHVRMHRGEFNQKDLAEAVNVERRNQLAVASWQQYASDRQTLAFTVDVAHAHALAATFDRAGIKAAALSGETPKDLRREMLRAFEAGTVQIITNCMVLTEGTDLPIASCILHAKPTKSATLYEQMTGRGLRIFPGKTDCLVIDIVDIARRHSLQSSPVLYGLPPSLVVKGKNLKQVKEEFAALEAKYPGIALGEGERMTLEQLAARASSFDVWTVMEMGDLGQGLALDWLREGTDKFQITYPWEGDQETVRVEPDLLEKFNVVLTRRHTIQAPGAGRVTYETSAPRTIAAGVVDAQQALRLGEAFIAAERRTVAKLKDKGAAWKGVPATEKQIKCLARLRVPVKPGLSSGEASQLIALALARKGRH